MTREKTKKKKKEKKTRIRSGSSLYPLRVRRSISRYRDGFVGRRVEIGPDWTKRVEWKLKDCCAYCWIGISFFFLREDVNREKILTV